MILQRLFLYSTLGALLHYLGYPVSSVEFWCFVALFWAAEQTKEQEVYEELNQELEAMRRRNSAHKQEEHND